MGRGVEAMKCVADCPICGGSRCGEWPGVLAPFMADRLGINGPIPCQVLECGECGFRYSDLRLDEQEVSRLYENYRGETYFQVRHAREPWYTRGMNQGLGADPEAMRTRQDRLADLLKAEGLWDTIHSVLDFGGDRGQFIPSGLGGEKWVYDISAVQVEPGICACSRLDELGRDRFDLVMMCHVLEHVMEPVALLDTTAALVAEGRTLYVEVPLERTRIGGVRRSPISHPGLHKALDFFSTVTRVMLGWLPRGTQLKVSEHVNFFDERSLRAAMERAGLRVIRLEARTSNRLFGRSGTLHCLAEKPADG